jgi:putative DNA primase/helicase
LESSIGLICDYKYGINSSYEVLKIKGKDREVLSDPPAISNIPRWLYPRNEKSVEKSTDFQCIVGLTEGSRDDTLYQWSTCNLKRSDKSKLKGAFNVMANISKQDFIDMMTIINKFIFDDPLDDHDFAKFTAQDFYEEKSNFAVENQKKDKVDPLTPAVNDMIEKCGIRQFGNALFRKGDLKYYKLLNQVFIDNELIAVRQLDPEKATAATRLLKAHVKDEYVPYDTSVIGFRNGCFDWKTMEFAPYAADTVVFRYYDVDYLIDVDTSFMKSILLDWCQNDLTKYQMLIEMSGTFFYSGSAIKKWWEIDGKADTGKTTYLKLLTAVIGVDMVGSTPLQSLKDPNAIAELVGKSVNIVDDGSANYTTDLSNLRRIIQGDNIQVKVLYQDKFTTRIECRMLFVFNETPKFRDNNNATAKKMMVIRFNRVYSDEEKDVHLIEKLTTDMNKAAFVRLAIDAMITVIHNNLTFTVSDESREAVEQVTQESDQFQSFVADIADEKFDWKEYLDDKETAAVYREFRDWARNEGYQNIIIQKTFSEKIRRISGAGIRKSNGKCFFCFNKGKDTSKPKN